MLTLLEPRPPICIDDFYAIARFIGVTTAILPLLCARNRARGPQKNTPVGEGDSPPYLLIPDPLESMKKCRGIGSGRDQTKEINHAK